MEYFTDFSKNCPACNKTSTADIVKISHPPRFWCDNCKDWFQAKTKLEEYKEYVEEEIIKRLGIPKEIS